MNTKATPHTPTFTVTYRDGYGTERTFSLQASDYDSAVDAANEWKGAAPISIVSVVEVFNHDGLTHCAACGHEIETHPDDDSDFVEFPAGEFPGAALAKAGAA